MKKKDAINFDERKKTFDGKEEKTFTKKKDAINFNGKEEKTFTEKERRTMKSVLSQRKKF
ncbi:hypothetical protein COX85_00620 [Candidatus Micrarchaeota archaeon CG_4_10_14_0_2_um_filter_55_9]|nr:MAG: hypothetical protein AUJ15_01115 [Candidatus Micrarchaeota archaeon CG1_02_55_41]PIO03120.1 MAG: hypothetical protein COT57_01035 [Candidatus Micrarchaeota archaeon CG09_land_8_20_14_0_10_55_25]PIZ92031.1 MAG: hypothetical protein COX85_00620 [Candidatus Micrarchaeota archaeon CG_4_10_14_0_2_um_filter_55_9]PJD00931.1 MAG: hypothetical protein COU38_03595 [Candidatus Micrarchaeota archaeon CG10_big_fil_rev_8_21_14_0_10_54_18]